MPAQASRFSNLLLWGRECIPQQWSLIKPDPWDLYFSNWGADPTLARAGTAQCGQEAPPHPAQALKPQHNTHSLPRAYGQHTRRKDMAGVHTKTSPCNKILDTDYTGMLPHRNTPSRPQQITVSPKFIETDEVQ